MTSVGWFLGAGVVALTAVLSIGDWHFDGGYRALHLGLVLAALLAGIWSGRHGHRSAFEWIAALAWIVAAALALVHPLPIAAAALAVGLAGGSALLRSVVMPRRSND